MAVSQPPAVTRLSLRLLRRRTRNFSGVKSIIDEIVYGQKRACSMYVYACRKMYERYPGVKTIYPIILFCVGR